MASTASMVFVSCCDCHVVDVVVVVVRLVVVVVHVLVLVDVTMRSEPCPRE